MQTVTFTQSQLDACPKLADLGFSAGITYDFFTVIKWFCLYTDMKPEYAKGTGNHPPIPPNH